MHGFCPAYDGSKVITTKLGLTYKKPGLSSIQVLGYMLNETLHAHTSLHKKP